MSQPPSPSGHKSPESEGSSQQQHRGSHESPYGSPGHAEEAQSPEPNALPQPDPNSGSQQQHRGSHKSPYGSPGHAEEAQCPEPNALPQPDPNSGSQLPPAGPGPKFNHGLMEEADSGGIPSPPQKDQPPPSNTVDEALDGTAYDKYRSFPEGAPTSPGGEAQEAKGTPKRRRELPNSRPSSPPAHSPKKRRKEQGTFSGQTPGAIGVRPRLSGTQGEECPRPAGYDAGYDAGYNAGYDAGYDAGYKRSREEEGEAGSRQTVATASARLNLESTSYTETERERVAMQADGAGGAGRREDTGSGSISARADNATMGGPSQQERAQAGVQTPAVSKRARCTSCQKRFIACKPHKDDQFCCDKCDERDQNCSFGEVERRKFKCLECASPDNPRTLCAGKAEGACGRCKRMRLGCRYGPNKTKCTVCQYRHTTCDRSLGKSVCSNCKQRFVELHGRSPRNDTEAGCKYRPLTGSARCTECQQRNVPTCDRDSRGGDARCSTYVAGRLHCDYKRLRS